MNRETSAKAIIPGFPPGGGPLSLFLAASIALGAAATARASNRATWTGAAGNGLFQDSGNWTCFNESDEQVVGIPAADTAITLDADVPANGWADANFAEMSGSIDLAGHSLTVPKTFFDGATPALTDLIVNGDFEADAVPEGETSVIKVPTGWTGSANSDGYVYVTRNDPATAYNNKKKDNGCYVVGNRWIEQSFTLPEDAVLSLSFNRINKNAANNSYNTSNGKVLIDGGLQVLSWSDDRGWGEKSYSATFALAAGDHTIRFAINVGAGSTFDNIKLTYQPSARTVTDSVGDGELHVNVPEGETATNVDVNMTGHLKLVKEGAGAFVSQRNALTYDSGTIVAAGTLSTTEGAETGETVNRAFGALGSSMTVCTGATLLNGGDGCDFRNYNVVLDGGTLAAGAAGMLVETNGVCSVSVGANGGTLDNGGFAVTVAADIAGTGALAFTGSGKTTLAAGVSIACPAIVESGVTLSVPGTDTATFGSLTLAGGSTLDLAAYVVGVAPIAVSTLDLPENGTIDLTFNSGGFGAGQYAICAMTGITPEDGLKFAPSSNGMECKWSVEDDTLLLTVGIIDPNTWTGDAEDGNLSNPDNWYGRAVPASGTAIINIGMPGTLTVGATFAPDAILFPEGCAALVIEGDAITGIYAITNLSDATQTFNAPVRFADKIHVVQNAKSYDSKDQSSVRFAGGAYGTAIDSSASHYINGAYFLSEANSLVANTHGSDDRYGMLEGSSLTVPAITDTSELALGGEGGTTPAGGAFTAAVVRTSARLCCYNGGEYVVTEELYYTLEATRHLAYRYSSGKFKFEKVTISDDGKERVLYFANSGNYLYDKNVWIGAGGLNFAEGASAGTAYVCGRRDNDEIWINPWHSDYTISTKPGSTRDIEINKSTHFGTTDENGVARNVTLNGIMSGSGSVSIEGAGRFIVNNVNTVSGAVTVKDTATLAINAGKVLTSGNTTVNSGATLSLPQSGLVTLAGDLTLADGAMLAFNFTDRAAAPQIAIADGKTVTANGAVTVKISGDVRPTGGVKLLTTGGGFDGATVTLAASAPDWAKGRFSVNADGNIVLDVKPAGTKVIVR